MVTNVSGAADRSKNEPIHLEFNGISVNMTEVEASVLAWTIQSSIAELRRQYCEQ